MLLEWSHLQTVLFAGLTALTAMTLGVVLLFRNSRGTCRLRRRLVCPVEGSPATVDFVVVGYEGEVCAAVACCSLLDPGQSPDCGHRARSVPRAHFCWIERR